MALESCRRGDVVTCKNLQVPGISYDGGYADYMIAPIEALASIPEQLSAIEAAPLMCAGITTYNALRNSGARPGDVVGILGMGGLGHLGIQFAAKFSFNTVAIGRARDKEEELMKKLGARQYIDNKLQNAVEELNKLGGAKVTLATVQSGVRCPLSIPAFLDMRSSAVSPRSALQSPNSSQVILQQ